MAFAVAGIPGLIGNTATLVIAADFLPVGAAKILAIGVGFLVNFSLSHFVVFRPKKPSTTTSRDAVSLKARLSASRTADCRSENT